MPRKLDLQHMYFPSNVSTEFKQDRRPWEKSADRSPKLALTAAKCLAGTNVQAQLAIKKKPHYSLALLKGNHFAIHNEAYPEASLRGRP